MPRVLYVGNLGPGSPEHATENDVRRAFERLGWEVGCVAERDFTAAAAQGGEAWARIVGDCGSADLVLHTMTQGSYPHPERVTGLWEILRGLGVPTASIHLDLFYGLSSPKDSGPQRQELPRLHPMFRVDHVFTADGGHDKNFANDGVNHHWLPPAVRHDEARRIEPTDEDRAKWAGFDVAFVGSTGYHKEYPERNELVARLRDRYGSRFVHIGNGGDRCNNRDEPNLRGEALNRMYAQIPVIVGDYCFANRQPSFYWSDRFPEVWGRGGFLVFPYTAPLSRQLAEYQEARGWTVRDPDACYPGWNIGDWDGLWSEVDGYLANRERIESWRKMIQPWIAAEHCYTNRVQTMLATVFPTKTLLKELHASIPEELKPFGGFLDPTKFDGHDLGNG